MGTVCSSVASVVLEYDTAKVVHIRSKKVGIINRLIQIVIIAYILGYAIIYKKGYQETELPTGAVTAKLKGVGYTDRSSGPNIDGRVWDPADYHLPPQQTNGFFVMTNMIISPDQINGTCPESFKNMPCTSDSNCTRGEAVPAGNGIMTGKCVAADGNESFSENGAVKRSCEIVSWCPLQDDVTGNVSLLGHYAKNFTVLLKNYVLFRRFDVRRRNIGKFKSPDQLKACRFDPNDPLMKGCPIIQLYKIFEYAGVADQWDSACLHGAVMAIDILWNCNLDHGEDSCHPEYTFRRVDDPRAALSPGFNFRYAQYYEKLLTVNGTQVQVQARNLTKAYGILFTVNVRGQAGKFSPVPLFVNLGSGLALLGAATILCDFIALHFLSKRRLYNEKKFEHVDVDDDLFSEDSPLLTSIQTSKRKIMESTS